MTLPPDARTTYDATDPVEDNPLAHKHALVRAVKRIIELSAHLDVDETDDDTVEQLTADLDAIADRMDPLPTLHAKGGLGACGGHQGALLEAGPLPDISLEELDARSREGPLVALDQVTDPHNVGAVLRSAAVFGAAGVILTRRHGPPLLRDNQCSHRSVPIAKWAIRVPCVGGAIMIRRSTLPGS